MDIAADFREKCCAKCGRPFSSTHGGLTFVGSKNATYIDADGRERVLRMSYRHRDVMLVLASRFGQVVHRDVIYTSVWGNFSDVVPKIVDVMISQIRARLKGSPYEIKTEWGVGWSLHARDVGNVVRLNSTTSQETTVNADRA
jgi:DNA-binding response OmpR family regulator